MGSKGERYYDWAFFAVNCDSSRGFQRWLLFRRSLEHPDDPRFISYYQVFAPSKMCLETMVQIAQARWRIEECFKFAKDSLGLGEYEVRSGARLASTHHPRPSCSNISECTAASS
jgi:hypothetical protein